MPGFRVTNFDTEVSLKNYESGRCIQDIIIHENWFLKRNTLNKFIDDKLFVETDEFIILLEGIIYNKKKLEQTTNSHAFSDAVQTLLKTNIKELLKKLDGIFSGAVLYKKENRLIIFTSLLGEKAVFYYWKHGRFIAGSQLNYITDILKHLDIRYEADLSALSQFLAYGSYIDTSTCAVDIKRLYPGTYLELYDNILSIQEYNKIEFLQRQGVSEHEWIEMLDTAFLRSVKKVIEKNKEYGFCSLVDISGGLDSRMIACTAERLSHDDILLDSYGESGCDDVKIAEKIAHMLKLPLIFRSTDNAECMLTADQNIQMNNGAAIYYGITGGKDMLEMLDRQSFGMELTGLLGDVFDGSMVITYPDGEIDADYSRFRCSSVLKYGEQFDFPILEEKRFNKYKNELFWFHARGMLFGMSSYFIRQNFTEVASPFGDMEFLKVYLSIPWQIRVKGHLLRKWLIKKYPSMGDIKYANEGITVKDSLKRIGKIKERIQVTKRKIALIKQKKPMGMNDISFWYRTNKKFKEYITTYYLDNIEKVNGEIKNKVNDLYRSREVRDKLLAISVLAIYKNYLLKLPTRKMK